MSSFLNWLVGDLKAMLNERNPLCHWYPAVHGFRGTGGTLQKSSKHELDLMAQKAPGAFFNQTGNKDKLRSCTHVVLKGVSRRLVSM